MTIDPVSHDEAAVSGHPPAEARPAPVPDPDMLYAHSDRPLSGAARRALLEAAERRAASAATVPPTEHGGPAGLEPTRYGDWEKKGLAVDF